jgi:hypothetical protein
MFSTTSSSTQLLFSVVECRDDDFAERRFLDRDEVCRIVAESLDELALL